MMKQVTLRQARILANYTQSELAEKIGVSAQMIGLWENGKSIPNAKRFMALCEVCKLAPTEIKL